jgi:hypothetical protein
MYYLADEGSSTHSTSRRSVNNNYRLFKLSHIILWLAEIEAEAKNLDKAEEYVNMIRNRAKSSKVQDASVNNVVNPYPAGTFAANGQDFIRRVQSRRT